MDSCTDCIYYNILSGTNIMTDKPHIKILCEYLDKPIKEIPDTERVDCKYFKTKIQIKEEWRNYLK